MNKKGAIAVIVALFVPIFSYLLMKGFNQSSEKMPGHYLLDSTVTTIVDGREKTDRVWHKVKDIKLVNQLGDTVHLYDLKNKSIVCDFFFTSCGSICPFLTKNMARLQRSFRVGGDAQQKNVDTAAIQFVSFSIDPERDSVTRLKEYADRYGASNDNWWFLTGNKDSIYRFIFEELKVDKYDDAPIDPNFAHTGRFVLLDKNFYVRGFYNGLDTAHDLPKLAEDAAFLMLEKDKLHPAPLPFDPSEMIIALIIGIVIVVLIMSFLKKKKK